ncbi:MAG: hypothetical protein ACRC7R_05395, partial [Sarcina sp.]
NMIKFTLGNIPLVLITCTSFILAWDSHKEFRCVKKEAIFDWIIRVIAFGISIEGIHYLKSSNMIYISIFMAFILNCITEFIIYKKVSKNYSNANIKKELEVENEEITLEEKNKLEDLKKAINSSFFSFFIFGGMSLPISNTINMEGATMPKIFPLGISFFVFLWFISKNYENYQIFYSDKKFAKNKFIKDFTFTSIGYIACLVVSFINVNYKLRDYILFLAILFMIPIANTVHKKSLRLRYIIKTLNNVL